MSIARLPTVCMLFLMSLIGGVGATDYMVKSETQPETDNGITGPLACDFSAVPGPVLTGALRFTSGGTFPVKLPKAYFTGRVAPRDGMLGSQGTMYFSVSDKSFLPYPLKEMTREKIVSGKQDWLSLLFYRHRPLEPSARELAFYSGLSRSTKITEVPFANGLHTFTPTSSERLIWNTYVARERDGRISDSILCDPPAEPNNIPSPQCDHTTTIGPFEISITYPLNRLDQWADTKRRVHAFANCITKEKR